MSIPDNLPLRVQVLLSAQRALWEIPTPALRAVAVSWNAAWLHARFVYDVDPSENEQELISLFGTYLAADLSDHMVAEGHEVVPWPQPLSLGPKEEWVYLRYEPIRELPPPPLPA